MTRIENKTKKDDDEKFACNKDNILNNFKNETEYRLSMKKK